MRNFASRSSFAGPAPIFRHFAPDSERWIRSDGWYVGQIEEMPEAISQGHTLQDLVDMIQDAKATLDEKGA